MTRVVSEDLGQPLCLLGSVLHHCVSRPCQQHCLCGRLPVCLLYFLCLNLFCVSVCVCVNFVGSVSTAVLCVQVHFRTGTETSESCQRFFNQTWREKSEPWAEWETLGWIYDAQTFKILHLANLQLFCHFLDLPFNYRIFEPNLQSFLVKVLVVFDWFKTFCRHTHTTTVLLFCYVLAKISTFNFFEATFC